MYCERETERENTIKKTNRVGEKERKKTERWRNEKKGR